MRFVRPAAPIALLALLSAAVGCDQVGKAIDANNNQPGEADSRAVALTSFPVRMTALTSDEKEIFAVAENGDVLSRPREGNDAAKRIGGVKRTYTTRERILVDADALWIASEDGLSRMPRAGGDAEKIAVDAFGRGIAQTPDAVFISSKDQKRVLRIDKKTREAKDLAGGFTRIEEITGDAERIYVADGEGDTITAVPIIEGVPSVLVKDQAHPEYIGVGPDHVYWVNGSLSDHKEIEDRLFRVKKSGGTAENLAAVSGGFRGPIAADAEFVYLGRAGYGLFRAPVAGGEAKKFANTAVTDFFLTADKIISVENNGFRFSDAEKNQPNRLLSITKK